MRASISLADLAAGGPGVIALLTAWLWSLPAIGPRAPCTSGPARELPARCRNIGTVRISGFLVLGGGAVAGSAG